MKINKKLKWALALSGGGAKGFAHVGVLKALKELGFPEPSLVAGTSMGAIVGGVYASGMPVEGLVRFADEFEITDYLDSFVFKVNGPVGRLLQTGQLLGSLAGSPGIDSGARVLALLEQLVGNKTFAEAKIPFRCNAVDLLSGREVIFSGGSLARAIRASMSYPVFFEPMQIGNYHLVDGGLADNLPVHIAAEEGFKHILAINVGSFKTWTAPAQDAAKGEAELGSSAKIVSRSLDIALHRMYQRGQTFQAELTLSAVNGANALAFHQKKELIALGEQTVRDNAADLGAFFGLGLEAYLGRRQYRRRQVITQEIPIFYTEDTHAETQ